MLYLDFTDHTIAVSLVCDIFVFLVPLSLFLPFYSALPTLIRKCAFSMVLNEVEVRSKFSAFKDKTDDTE